MHNMTRVLYALFYWLPPALWMLFILPLNPLLTADHTSSVFTPLLFWLAPSADPTTIDGLHTLVRKIGHFFAYAMLTFLLFRAFRGSRNGFAAKWLLFAGFISLGYSALDESLQMLIPTRTGSLSDWIIDALGIVVCIVIILIHALRGRRSRRNTACQPVTRR